jgi:hypothetical protein
MEFQEPRARDKNPRGETNGLRGHLASSASMVRRPPRNALAHSEFRDSGRRFPDAEGPECLSIKEQPLIPTSEHAHSRDLEPGSGIGLVAGAGVGLVLDAILGLPGFGLVLGPAVGLSLGAGVALCLRPSAATPAGPEPRPR